MVESGVSMLFHEWTRVLLTMASQDFVLPQLLEGPKLMAVLRKDQAEQGFKTRQHHLSLPTSICLI
jgi:hypothetical protein